MCMHGHIWCANERDLYMKKRIHDKTGCIAFCWCVAVYFDRRFRMPSVFCRWSPYMALAAFCSFIFLMHVTVMVLCVMQVGPFVGMRHRLEKAGKMLQLVPEHTHPVTPQLHHQAKLIALQRLLNLLTIAVMGLADLRNMSLMGIRSQMIQLFC